MTKKDKLEITNYLNNIIDDEKQKITQSEHSTNTIVSKSNIRLLEKIIGHVNKQLEYSLDGNG